MSIVPSEVGKVKEMASPEEEWAWAVEGLKEVHAHANAEGVRIAIEPLNRFETNFLNRHDQALLLAEEVGDDVGVCLDVYHMNQEEADMLQAFRNAGDRLFDVHVADNNRMACGQGELDWARDHRHAARTSATTARSRSSSCRRSTARRPTRTRTRWPRRTTR